MRKLILNGEDLNLSLNLYLCFFFVANIPLPTDSPMSVIISFLQSFYISFEAEVFFFKYFACQGEGDDSCQ